MITITVVSDGIRETHLPSINDNYATLCGLDGSDDSVGQETVPTEKGEKVNCTDCIAIWEYCKKIKKSIISCPN